jgi:hypothetical protein
MVIEGIIVTSNPDGRPHIAPMGAIVDDPSHDALERVLLRPYRSSTTFANLDRLGEAIFHVTDDVLLLARAAVGRLYDQPELTPAVAVNGWILAAACRWYALRVWQIGGGSDRAVIETEVVQRGRLRDFAGFNRAKHAVVEAAILATRTGFLPHDEIRAQFDRLAALVEKTGGPQEHEAWTFLARYLDEKIGA